MPLLTIAIPTFDDYRGLSMTLQSLNMHHRGLGFDLLVFDNFNKCERSKKAAKNAKARLISDDSIQGTCYSKSRCVQEALGKFVLVIDSHVMLDVGSIFKLLNYLESNTKSARGNIYHGPLVSNAGEIYATELRPTWGSNAWGKWHNRITKDHPLPDQPFDIWGHGCGAFCVSKEAWPGYHPRCRGFGGEEGIIQEHYRARGGKAICLPFLQWTHSFNDGAPVTHTVSVDDKFRNNMLGITGLPNEEQLWADCIGHFSQSLPMNKIVELCKVCLPGKYVIDTKVALSLPTTVNA